ncbi:hypothetical protein [Miltoncostaea oceani]|uniref:hypothetical protein n=1 Tax=Miltoncostaea oceani TaxID=2843216 RepID=UPI001C3C46CD|nr:hypothetical protein [Miltoncostaea oceani]
MAHGEKKVLRCLLGAVVLVPGALALYLYLLFRTALIEQEILASPYAWMAMPVIIIFAILASARWAGARGIAGFFYLMMCGALLTFWGLSAVGYLLLIEPLGTISAVIYWALASVLAFGIGMLDALVS